MKHADYRMSQRLAFGRKRENVVWYTRSPREFVGVRLTAEWNRGDMLHAVAQRRGNPRTRLDMAAEGRIADEMKLVGDRPPDLVPWLPVAAR
jgi:hypothetical protein